MKSDNLSFRKEILRLYLKNRYAKETEEKVQEWIIDTVDSMDAEEVSRDYWNAIKPQKDKNTIKHLREVNAKIGAPNKARKINLTYTFLRVAAVFILLIGLSGILFYTYNYNGFSMIEASASYGETKQIILPDNSMVWLNAGSTIKYPSKFNAKSRLVSLDGEAFFTVTKDESSPFVVKTEYLSVKVLGTKFNLKAYVNEYLTVATLQEGSIEIETINQQKRQLVPNEQLIFNNQKSAIEVVAIDPIYIPDWKNGNLIFSNSTMGEILQTLNRQYDIFFDVAPSLDLSSEKYTIRFNQEESVEQILLVMEDIVGDFTYVRKNNRIELLKTN